MISPPLLSCWLLPSIEDLEAAENGFLYELKLAVLVGLFWRFPPDANTAGLATVFTQVKKRNASHSRNCHQIVSNIV